MRNKRRIFCNFAVIFVETTLLVPAKLCDCCDEGMILSVYDRQNFS